MIHLKLKETRHIKATRYKTKRKEDHRLKSHVFIMRKERKGLGNALQEKTNHIDEIPRLDHVEI